MKSTALLIGLSIFLLLLPSAFASCGYVYNYQYSQPSTYFHYSCQNFPCSSYHPTYSYSCSHPTYTYPTYTHPSYTYQTYYASQYQPPAPSYVCTPGQTRNKQCSSTYGYQYDVCNSAGTGWSTTTGTCTGGSVCVNGNCGSCGAVITISASPNSIWPAQTISITGNLYPYSSYGFPQMVYLYLDSNYFGSVSTDSSGYFSYTYTTPGSISGGTHTVRADASVSGCGSNSAYATFYVNSGPSQVCTAGEIRNRYCDSSNAVRYEVCQNGNSWTTVASACPADTTCQNGYCSYQYNPYYNYQYYYDYSNYYPYYYDYSNYAYNYGYGNLIVSVKDCSNNNLIPATVSISPGYPGNYERYSSTGVVSFNDMPSDYYTITASSQDYNMKTTFASVYSYQTATSDVCLDRRAPEGKHCLKVEKFESTLIPGETAQVKVAVSNCGTITESNVKAKLKMFDKTSVLTFPTLESGDEETVTFDVEVPSDAVGEEKSSVLVSNDWNSILAKKTFVVSFGIPQVLLKDSYKVNRCDINTFSFDIYNLGKAKDTFKITVEGDAAKWIYLSPDEVTVEAKEKVSVDAYASVPCGTDVGEYTFTITAQGSPKSSATSSLNVVDKKGVTGLIIFPVLNQQWAWLLILLGLLILVILIIWFLTKNSGKMRFGSRSQTPEFFKPCC